MTVARVSVRFSKSLARRRFRPSQEKVRSTTPAARQDDEAVHGVAPPNDLHAKRRYFCHRSFNLPRLVAAMGLDRFEPREVPPATRSGVMGIVTMCIGTGPVGVMAIGIPSGQVGSR